MDDAADVLVLRPTRLGRAWIVGGALRDALLPVVMPLPFLPWGWLRLAWAGGLLAVVLRRCYAVEVRCADGRVLCRNRFATYELGIDEIRSYDLKRLAGNGPTITALVTSRPSRFFERKTVGLEATASNDVDRINATQDTIRAWVTRERRRAAPERRARPT